jgi:CheY-like chemotaxis protein
LIVDDEPRNLTVLEAILEDPSYRLIRAESAEQALLALLADDFALAVLDIRMPRAKSPRPTISSQTGICAP